MEATPPPWKAAWNLTREAQRLVTRLLAEWEREEPENRTRWERLEYATRRAQERVKRRWDRQLELQRAELRAIAGEARRLRGAC